MAISRVISVIAVVLTVLSRLNKQLVNANPDVAKPNIVFIVADDMGWDDVSYHGSEQTLTPNIDLLAATGVALARHYTHCVCTPSRAALLTGKYAHTTGMQGYPLTNGEDRGLPLSEKLLPEYLKQLGYSTHLVGKWHLGHSRTDYLPTNRGFDTHFGYRGGYIDYYEYLNEEQWTIGQVSGMDLYRNLTPAWDVEGYITDVFTNEAKKIITSHNTINPLFLMLSHTAPHGGNDGAILQAPPETVRSMRHIESPERRIFAAMMKILDESVGEVVTALANKGILNNTIIVFISDNGGMPKGSPYNSVNFASNWPLRGSKFSPFEGGIRTAGFVWSPQLMNANHLWNGYIHVVDWLPTLLSAIGERRPEGIDGTDLWNEITTNKDSKRTEVFEIFFEDSFQTVISGDFKLVTGNVTRADRVKQGGDFRGIIGVPPSYIDSVEKSDVNAVLRPLGYDYRSVTDLRNKIRVNCKSADNFEELCHPSENKMCLFNIKDDPCEILDVSATQPEMVERLLSLLTNERTRLVNRIYPPFRDPRALPRLFNYTWATWADEI